MTTVIAVREAVGLVKDGATVVIGGSGAGHALPQRFIDELAAVYAEQGRPRDLTTVRVVGIGDFADRGFSQLGLPGLMKRTIGSNIGNEPRLGALVEANELESYSFPQGVLSQLMREIAAGRPGLVTGVGLGTYVDPRLTAASRTAGRRRTSSRSSRSAAGSGCCSTPSRSTSLSSAARPPMRTGTSRWRERLSRARCSRWPWRHVTAVGSSSPRSASWHVEARCRYAT